MHGLRIQHINIPGRISDPLPPNEGPKEEEQHPEQPKEAKPPTSSKLSDEPLVLLDSSASSAAMAPPTSTVLLWLLATTLSLITAPLVEPRYFILPWVFWRLLVPAWPAHECTPPETGGLRLSQVSGFAWLYRVGSKVDLRLMLETLWFITINMGTMYIFLTRPFFWRAPDGTLLDEGKMQRFMW
jgi:alpha-1,2-glucosyltransferase